MDHLVWGAALSKLHSTIGELTEEDLCIRIHYWGALAEHRSNLEHKHSFLKCVMSQAVKERMWMKGGSIR